MRDRYLFSSDDQAKYCLLPSDEQKDTAQRMASEHGIDFAKRYLAAVTDPKTIGNGKYGGRFTGNRELPQIKLGQLQKNFNLSGF
jgi:hypothetical protein